tara:strand:+ start:1474 stop:1929 length:456 start_codon:yes stop_codon:yes gene_type:complete
MKLKNWECAWNQLKDVLLLILILNGVIGYFQSKEEVKLTFENPAIVIPVEERIIVEVKEEKEVAEVSAYNAEAAQTDSSPDIMASGKKVYEGAVANNCLKFGSKVEIGGKIYTVEDRMNKRYGCDHFDIFVAEKSEAIAFGRKNLEYKVLD